MKWLILLIASAAYAQMFPFPGPGMPPKGGTCCTIGTAKADEYFGSATGDLAAVNRPAGSGIFCVASWDGFTGSVTFSNTAGDTWIPLNTWSDASNFQRFATAYVASSNGNAADVVHSVVSVTPTQSAVSCIDFSGQDATFPLNGFTFGAADSSTSVITGPYTTLVPSQLMIAGMGAYAASGTWSAGNIGGSAATIPSGATSPFKFISLEYVIVTQSNIQADANISPSNPALGIGVAAFK